MVVAHALKVNTVRIMKPLTRLGLACSVPGAPPLFRTKTIVCARRVVLYPRGGGRQAQAGGKDKLVRVCAPVISGTEYRAQRETCQYVECGDVTLIEHNALIFEFVSIPAFSMEEECADFRKHVNFR